MLTLSYVELTVTDLERAQEFYAAAFGWEFNAYGPGYAGIRSADGSSEQGGLAVGDEPTNGGPLVLLETPDLEATLTAVTTAGGQLVGEVLAYPGGRRFLFLDPAGNRLGVFQSDHAAAE